MVTDPRRGEVWWGEIEDVGRRPFLVMTRTAAIPVLHVGRMHHHFEQMSDRVHHDVPFAPVDLLSAVIAASPPFRVVFTL